MTALSLPGELIERLALEARRLGTTPQERIVELLDAMLASSENLSLDLWRFADGQARLKAYLTRLPAVSVLSTSPLGEPDWWLKIVIDIEHPLAWHVVQALGFVLNYISLEERLPTRFMPVSPPPYLNGGPGEFLAWVIAQ
jgi:hypothetical protein